MSKFHTPLVVEQRTVGGLRWLQLESRELAERCRAGHYLLVRCAPVGSADLLLRRAVFVAGVEKRAGRLQLLFDPAERGLLWLASQQVGTTLDVLGPLGKSFALEQRAGNMLLVGQGAGLAALLFLAAEAVQRGGSVVLLAAAADTPLLPPPYLLPPDVEYQTTADAQGLLQLLGADGQQAAAHLPNAPASRVPFAASLITWADQLCASVPDALLTPLANAVRAQRLRWRPEFAQVALSGTMPCGTGACLGCLVETRDGWRTRCKDGPVFDLRDFR